MENTGMIMKRPSMRSAKMAASDTVARSSGALRRVDVADGLDIRNGKWMRVASSPAGWTPGAAALFLLETAPHATDGSWRAGFVAPVFGTRARAPRPAKVVIVAGLALLLSRSQLEQTRGRNSHSWGSHPQFEERQSRLAASQADRDYGVVRVGQVVARLRYALRRRSAPLRR